MKATVQEFNKFFDTAEEMKVVNEMNEPHANALSFSTSTLLAAMTLVTVALAVGKILAVFF